MIYIFPIELRFLTSASARLLAGRSDGDFGVYDFVFHTMLEDLTIMSRASQEYIQLTKRDKSAELLEKSIFGLWKFNNLKDEKSNYLTTLCSLLWRGKADNANRWAIALKIKDEIEQLEVIVPDKGSIMWDISLLEEKFHLDATKRENLAELIGQFSAAQTFKGHASPFILRL